jgi:hypothetical protein
MERARGRRLGALGAMVALLATGTACSAAPTSGTIRALSYNVAGLPAGISSSQPEVNTPLISPKLNAYDLVLVQEDFVDPVPPADGFDFHHDDLVSAVDHPYRSAPSTPPLGQDPRRPTALVADGLNVLSRIALGDTVHVMWDGCFGGIDTSDHGAADCLSLKGFSLTRLTLGGEATVDVYDLHGEAGETATDQALQVDDYRQLAAFVQRYSAGRAVILGGDTNLHTEQAADRDIWRGLLAATGLADVCDTVACGADVNVIDKFAVRDGASGTVGVDLTARTHVFEDSVFVRPDGAPLSDHRALSATIDWAATGGGS